MYQFLLSKNTLLSDPLMIHHLYIEFFLLFVNMFTNEKVWPRVILTSSRNSKRSGLHSLEWITCCWAKTAWANWNNRNRWTRTPRVAILKTIRIWNHSYYTFKRQRRISYEAWRDSQAYDRVANGQARFRAVIRN